MAGEVEGLRIVLLGAPGSGKGTQALRLGARLGVPAISTGEMLRAAVTAGTDLGHRVGSVMAAGALVDDALMADVVSHRLEQADARRGFLLDGYPRTISQAGTLEEMLDEQARSLDAVMLLSVPEEQLVARTLGRRRDDDRADVVRERLRVYHDKTEPLADYYRERGLLREIDGSQPMDHVSAALLSALGLAWVEA